MKDKKKKLVEMPQDLFMQIAKRAHRNDRSVNKEIVALLQNSVKAGIWS